MVENPKTSKNQDQPAAAEHPEPTAVPPVPDEVAKGLEIAPKEADDNPVEDPEIDKAVDDITTHEADEVIEAEDAELAKAFEPKTEPHGLKAKIVALASSWWHNKKARYGTFAGLAILLLLVISIPPSRYFVLNNVGVRSSASVVVIDQSTQQPLKNVDVTVAATTVKTDSSGTAKISHIKLGSTQLTIKRRAFAPISKKIVVGWGSNPYGSFSLNPTGSQYDFVITDFMSGKGVNKAEASANDVDATGDDKGNLVLTVDPNENSPLQVTVKADGYRDEAVSLNLDDKGTHKVSLVPSHKHAFISKRSGKYDLFAIDVDGKNESLLLAGTGTERSDLVLAPYPAADLVALVSSRDNVRNKDGYLLNTLNVIDTKTAQKTQVTQSEDIRIIDWIGDQLIFVKTVAGTSASTPNRQRLISYDYSQNSQKELASSNYFNDVVSAGGTIYFAPSDPNTAGFYKSNSDGTSKVNLLKKTTWNITRAQYNNLSLMTSSGDWYEYKLGDNSASKLSGAPANQQNRLYQDDSDRKHSLWVDARDGKGVLLETDTASLQDTVLRSQSGLAKPFYWLNDHYAVYRVHTEQETADYILNLDGGSPRKISNVNDTAGAGSQY